jgi:hypothetical protein
LFGLIPALSASRPVLASTLKESTSRSGTSLRQNKARGLLVVTEIALALVLLIGAALLIRTYIALRTVNRASMRITCSPWKPRYRVRTSTPPA